MKEKKIMGRPRKEIKWKEFEKLCEMQCTEKEIASFFDMTDDTLNARCKEHYKLTFSDTYRQKSNKGMISLRRAMWQSAIGGNHTMQIWLSKQYLGFSDKREDTVIETNFDVEFVNED